MNTKKILLTKLLKLFMAVLCIGVYFKFMAWPYASLLFDVPLFMLACLYPYRFWQKEPKVQLDYVKVVLVVVGALGAIALF
ncbi:MAG: hypothetical protein ACPGJS_20255 [Flammeovirgaceae bacterium]